MRLGLISILLPLIVLVGCSNVDVPFSKSTTGRLPTVAEVPEADETVRGAEDPPIVTLEVSPKFQERKLARSQDLPSAIIIPNTNLNSVPVTAALQAILDGTDISLSWGAGAYEERLVTVMNLSGSLSSVVKKICTSAKLFCSYRNGLLELKEQETFIIDLPAVPSKSGSSGAAANSMADTIKSLAGGNVKIDTQGGNLIYTTDVERYEYIREYLDQLRHGRPLVVMQLYIWEVELSHDNATGINWSKFDMGTFGGNAQELIQTAKTSFTDIASPGVNIGAKLTGKIDAEGVLKFLNKQGQVQTISNPQLTFVSGTKAEFRVGGEERYISEIGETNTVSGGSTSSNSITTDSIETGLTVIAAGTYENGILSSLLEITTQDVLDLNPTPTGDGRTINLPKTSERKVSTSIRVRPGDNLVLAGLVTSRDKNDRERIPLPFGLDSTAYSNDETTNTELVILVKPSIVKFSVKKERPQPSRDPKQFAPLDPFMNEQEAFVIDKNGSHTVTIPADTVSVLPEVEYKQATDSTQKTPDKKTLELPPILIRDERPEEPKVDKRLMQRGFSHAFDAMREPSNTKTRSVQ